MYQTQMRIYIGVNSLYALCILIAFFYPKLSVGLFAASSVYLALRSVVFMGIGKCNTNLPGEHKQEEPS